MKMLSKILNRRNLIVLAIIVCAVLVFRNWSASARAEAGRALFVPVIVSPSVQLVNGQALLFKVTNISEGPCGRRITLFNDREGLPMNIKDFPKITPRTTVTYLYNPPPGVL